MFHSKQAEDFWTNAGVISGLVTFLFLAFWAMVVSIAGSPVLASALIAFLVWLIFMISLAFDYNPRVGGVQVLANLYKGFAITLLLSAFLITAVLVHSGADFLTVLAVWIVALGATLSASEL